MKSKSILTTLFSILLFTLVFTAVFHTADSFAADANVRLGQTVNIPIRQPWLSVGGYNGNLRLDLFYDKAGQGVLLAATDQQKRPLFINNVAEGGVPVVLGAPVKVTKGAYKAGAATSGTTPAVPAIVGCAGDWSQAMYGTVEGVRITYSEDATLTDSNSNTINLFQKNMFAVRAEIEIGFRADTDCFNLLTAAYNA